MEEEEEYLGEKQRGLKRNTNGPACLVLFNEPLPGRATEGGVSDGDMSSQVIS